jgi:hypothetical protein
MTNNECSCRASRALGACLAVRENRGGYWPVSERSLVPKCSVIQREVARRSNNVFKNDICGFESYMPSHVGHLSCWGQRLESCFDAETARFASGIATGQMIGCRSIASRGDRPRR